MMDPINTPEHRIAMEARWLSESATELSTQAEHHPDLVAAELPLLISAYTRIAFLISRFTQRAA